MNENGAFDTSAITDILEDACREHARWQETNAASPQALVHFFQDTQ